MYECVGVWCMGVYMYECMGVWCMGVYIYECMSVCVYVYGCIGV